MLVGWVMLTMLPRYGLVAVTGDNSPLYFPAVFGLYLGFTLIIDLLGVLLRAS